MSPKLHAILIRLFFIVIFISATSVAYLLLPNEPTLHPRPPLFENGEENRAIATSSETTVIRTEIPNQVRDDNGKDSSSAQASLGMTVNTEKFQTATLAVNDQNYTLQFNAGENLLSAMRRLETSSVVPFIFAGREYSGLGFFVDEINGLKTDPNAGKYWIYYVNGEPAKIGISNYLLKSGDIIKWKYKG